MSTMQPQPPKPVTSRFFFGLFANEPGTGIDLDNRHVTVVDYAPDANYARNEERAARLFAISGDPSEAMWHSVIHGDAAFRGGIDEVNSIEHARIEYGPADIRDRERFRELYQAALTGPDRFRRPPTDDERRASWPAVNRKPAGEDR